MTIGIGYCIPNRKPGINWSSYWSPLSAVVENTSPADVVLTYASKVDPSDAIAGNFAISGKTISGASLDGTGKILTLTVTVAFDFGDSITVVANSENIAVTNNVNPDIGYNPAYTPTAQASASIYVDSAATGANNGTSWANAYTSLSTALTNSSDGSVIEVSGGAAGKTYTVNLDITKVITIQGSRASGHNALVTINGYIYSHNSTGTIKIINIKHTVNTSSYAFFSYANSSIAFYDSVLGNYITTNKHNEVYGKDVSFYNCTFLLSLRTSSISRSLFWPRAAATFTFDNCLLQYSGGIYSAASDTTVYAKNITSLQIEALYSLPLNNSTTLINSAFIGAPPLVTTAATNPPIVKNCFWHKTPLITGAVNDQLYFDSANIADMSNCIDHEIPYFTNVRNSLGGYLVVRYDDMANLNTSLSVANVLNPELKITHFIDIHSVYNQPTAGHIDTMRTLIAGGNEIGCHGGTHSDNSDLGIINITATGTSPTLAISGTRSGDSSTWTGTLTITINGTPKNYDLTTYDSIGDIITALNGDTVGDGTVTAVKNNGAHSSNLLSLCLADVVAQSISATYEMLLDDTAFLRFEITESILDLEAYINTGEDRNGNNAVVGTSVDPPATTYECKTFAAAYGRSRTSLATLLQGNANIIGAGLSLLGIYTMMYPLAQNIYGQAYWQMSDTNMEEDLFSMCAAGAIGNLIYMPLFHGYTPTFKGTVAGFKTLCQSFGVGDKTFAEIIEYLRTDGGWTITEPTLAFTGDYDDYLYQGDFSLQESSPLRRAGTKDVS